MFQKIQICVKIAWCLFVLLQHSSASGQINADFKVDKTSGCLPQLIRFEDLSTGNPTSWLWDFGNGNTSNLQNPSLIYIGAGIFTVKLTVSNATATDTETKTGYVVIYDNPLPDFTVNDDTACEEIDFRFTDNSQKAPISKASILQYFWDFGDGNTSAAKNPSHAYTTSGEMSVQLKVTDANGCYASKQYSKMVMVNPKPDVDFTTAKSNSCVSPLIVDFINLTGTGTFNYSWNFGNGDVSALKDPHTTYLTSGTFNVSLVAKDPLTGCSDTLVKPGFISTGNNVADFTVSKQRICEGGQVQFNINGTPPLFTYWDFGDGNSDEGIPVNHAYNSPGIYTVRAVVGYSSGCVDTVTKINFIEVDEMPVPMYSMTPKKSCPAPFNITFVNNVSGTSSFWDFGDGDTSSQRNIIHTYPAHGPWIIRFTAITPGGCRTTQTDTTDFAPKIDVSHDTDEFCGNVGTVKFGFKSDPATPNSWSWDFGDGNTSTLPKPTHTFYGEGTYLVTLTLTYGTCQARGYDTINVYTEPVPDFVSDKHLACVKKAINFTNLSSNYTRFIWDFGDGSKDSVNVNPLHTYSSYPAMPQLPDSFDITLTLINGTCRKDTVFPHYITINPPLAWFEPQTLCDTPGIVTLTDISRYLNPRDTVIRMWYFNDPNALRISNQQCTTDTRNSLNIGKNCNYSRDSIPTHYFKNTGDYEVKLWLYSKKTQCLDSIEKTVKIRLPFRNKAVVSDTMGCAPLAILFRDTARRSAESFWDFGDLLVDNDTFIGKNATYTYNRPGNYIPKLISTDADGCRVISFVNLYVRGPQANFRTEGKVCPPDTVKFKDLSTKTDKLVKWKWSFGDPASGARDSSSLQDPSHLYPAAGNYIVKLTLTDTLGCTHSATRIVEYGPPKPNFFVTPSTVCIGMGVDFTNITPYAFNNTYVWRFGNGDSSKLASPSYTYADTGVYDVKLIATRNDGCRDSLIVKKAVAVVDPSFNFNADTTKGLCPPFPVKFQSSLSPDIISVMWDFGDSSGSAGFNPLHTYTKPGKYTVKLAIRSAGGCSDTLIKQDFIVLGGPAGTFTMQPLAGCAPLKVTFKTDTKDAALYTWDLGDGNVINDVIDSATHTYTYGAAFHPKLILTDSNGCSLPFATTDSVVVHEQPVAKISSPVKTTCIGGSLSFSDISTSKATLAGRAWFYNETPVGSASPVFQQFDTVGLVQVRLIVFDNLSCSDTAIDTVRVNKAIVAVVSNDTTICKGSSVRLQASGGTSYQWFPPQGLSDEFSPNPIATPPSTLTYRVSVGGTSGCPRSEAEVTVNVRPGPAVDAGVGGEICKNDSFRLSASGADTIRWLSSKWLSDTLSANPWTRPDTSHWFALVGIDKLGCSSTDSVFVEVIPKPVSSASGPNVACVGAQVQLTASGGDRYLWSTGENAPSINPRIFNDTSFWVSASFRGCAGDTAHTNLKIVSTLLQADYDFLHDTFYTGQKVEIDNKSMGVVFYRWELPGTVSEEKVPAFSVEMQGEYRVTLRVKNADGCEDSVSKTVRIVPDFVFFPNAFTPNDDGQNNFFNYIGAFELEALEFVIIDRWGEIIFRSVTYNEFWDGTYKGVPVPEGVYGFYFKGRRYDGKPVQYIGNITLLR